MTSLLRRLVVQVLGDMNRRNTMVLAAGISYFASLAFFPTFAAALAISSVVIAPDKVASVVGTVNTYLPQDIASLVTLQLESQTGRHSGNTAIALIAIAISLFGASAAIENTLRSLNVVYGLKETRNPLKLRFLSFWMLLAAAPFAVLVTLLLVIGRYMTAWGVPGWLVDVVGVARWPILLVLVSWLFAALYRYGPNRPKAKWQWASAGVVVATALWMAATVLLFAYTRLFPTFGNAYTVSAGIVVLMVWLNMSAFALLVGAHINSRLESTKHT